MEVLKTGVAVLWLLCDAFREARGGGDGGPAVPTRVPCTGGAAAAALPCDLEPRYETLWFFQRRDALALAVSASRRPDRQGFHYVERRDPRYALAPSASADRAASLTIERVTPADQGLYYCADRDKGRFRIGRGARLVCVEAAAPSEGRGEAGNATRPGAPLPPGLQLPCLLILLTAPPLSALLSSVCVFCVFLRGAKCGRQT
ncbi:uncharacterized protein [Lepisosteus oculatus]|uniref:uncharacterized protein n=1 Tax=Lepisosteus oculatus TaxID=7918 RepID=UPI0035F51E23